VRSFAVVLGVFFHSSLSFVPVFIGWAVMDISTSQLVSPIALVSHSFRMPLFFLIAGFFMHRALQNKSWQQVLKIRLVQLGVPFILGWLLFKPLLVGGWITGNASMRGEADPISGLAEGFAIFSQLPDGLLIGTHLWFLYYLLLVSGLALMLRSIFTAFELNQWISTCMASIKHLHPCLTIFLASVPTSGCLWFMFHWGLDTPDKSLIPHLPVLVIYGIVFLFGWIASRFNLLENDIQFSKSVCLMWFVSVVMSLFLIRYESQQGLPNYMLLKTSFVISYAVMMWSSITLTISLSKCGFQTRNAIVESLSQASYWIYLIHLPIVIWLQIAFAELPMHWLIKLIAIASITLFISLMTYQNWVRSTWFEKILNGKLANPVDSKRY
jgi:fucose 4-O-acetylase-like acetyltransferase